MIEMKMPDSLPIPLPPNLTVFFSFAQCRSRQKEAKIMSDIMKAANIVQGAYDSFCQAVGDEGTMTVENRRLTYEICV